MTHKTHYENLKVANDAPSDVIRAAYKALSHKYNSDRNQSAEVLRQLELINASNSVLSNPVKRAEYDKWLLEQSSVEVEKKKSFNKQSAKKTKDVFDDNSEIIIGKESDVVSLKNKNNGKRWVIYTGIGLSVLIALAWFGFANDGPENNDNKAQNTNQPELVENKPNSSSITDTTLGNGTAAGAEFKPDVTSIDIPAHDKVDLGKFIGLWQSSASAAQQSLNISKKSNNSIVFKLNAKTGQSISGVYGIADFQNSYALFFNEEYGCSIIFTIKSNMLQVSTSSCQEYHASGVATGVVFDGLYTKPGSIDVTKKTPVSKSNSKQLKATADTATQQPVVLPESVKNVPKLYKFSAKVKDAQGNVSDIELMAKDKDAARAIIRDFRGNPEVLKLKQLKK
ncbi:MAG TPA: DnaJ domain-containing protein [Arenimonas sp.]|nr:DnaJ domain-containing protein [Arenimonas sp.]